MLSKTIDGEWKHEPHRFEFKHDGLDCLLVRNFRMGNWCGYAGVKKGHPFFGKSQSEVDEAVPSVDVHGGVTYSQACHDYICHVVDNEEDTTWWIGFDCAHAWDFQPFMSAEFLSFGDQCVYRNFEYVERETKQLASQLAKRLA